MIILDDEYVPLDALDKLHPMAFVAWDRDNVSDYLAQLEPDSSAARGYPRLYSRAFYDLGGGEDDLAIVTVFYGKSHERVVDFIADPVPHWTPFVLRKFESPPVRAGTPRRQEAP